MTAAINLFATAVVNERRIPFEIRSKSLIEEETRELFESARAHVLSKHPNGMTLEEINAIIDESRKSD
jgi:antitoxin component of RelBE/YafQ-DinJ toxin-antitoxin module